jgi:uncharacterized membrane protein YGL010W
MRHARTAIDLLSRYAACHRDQRNITTHLVGVPLTVFGAGVLLSRARFELGGMALSAAWLLFALAALWYLSRRGAFLLSLAVTAATGLLVAAAHAVAPGAGTSWLGWGVGSAAAGWVVLFLGHCYEGKRPPVADGAAALLVAPMFVTAEALFALGWNKPLLAEIERRAGPTYLRDLAHPA